ncbi:hypothetical protein BKA65DRAFT_537915 [Rhexocercosporidium sp. MPI-PUGE-AT-0058]|nr:hypothetical protein BKA65DRAFT_537915 [Rhexocercosporidium sp. MPI-PUGE-AT-0058]
MTGTLSGQKISERGQRIIEWSLLVCHKTTDSSAVKTYSSARPYYISHIFRCYYWPYDEICRAIQTGKRGKVDKLEMLIGSQIVFAALMTQAVLAKLGPLGLGILLLPGQVAYLNMTSQISSFSAGYSAADSQHSVNALYTGCLIGDESTKNGEGWIGVSSNHTTYSSVLGIPLSGIPRDKSSSFNLQCYYHHLHCNSKDVLSPFSDWLTPLQIPWTSQYNTSTIWGNPKSRLNGTDTSPNELDLLLRSGRDLQTSQNITDITLIECSMAPTFVETSVQCEGRNCRVDKIRNSPDFRPLGVPLSLGSSQIWTLFASGLIKAFGVTSTYSTPTEHYLSGLIDLSTNLARIINTYWLASLAPWASTNNLPDDPSDLITEMSPLANFFSFAANGTDMITLHLEEVYSCNRGWLGALIVSSLLLFAAGVVDVLGYVSTLVANDPHKFEASQRGNSAMDGLERARYMNGIRIRLEDVREREQVGLVAVAKFSGRGKSARSGEDLLVKLLGSRIS